MHTPNRAIPATMLLLSLAGIVVVYAVPWMGTGSASIPNDWTWAHDMFGLFAGSSPRGDMWALAGLLLGAAVSTAWLALGSLLPAAQWTPAREAAVASLLAPSLFLVASAGGMGIGLSVLAADGSNWAVSPAGITLAAIAGLGLALLAAALLPRIPARRTPVYLLLGTIVAGALFYAVPWLTTTEPSSFAGATSPPDTTHYVRVLFQIFGFDPLGSLNVALQVMLYGALAWTLAVALLPVHASRDAAVDAAFSLAAFVPFALAATSIGRLIGASLAGYETFFGGGGTDGALAGDGSIVYAVNAYVFAALLLAAVVGVVAVLGRSTRVLTEGDAALDAEAIP